MLHIKFHCNQPTGSKEEDFLLVFTMYGHGDHLGHVTGIPQNKIPFLHPMEASHEIWLQSAQSFQRRRWMTADG